MELLDPPQIKAVNIMPSSVWRRNLRCSLSFTAPRSGPVIRSTTSRRSPRVKAPSGSTGPRRKRTGAGSGRHGTSLLGHQDRLAWSRRLGDRRVRADLAARRMRRGTQKDIESLGSHRPDRRPRRRRQLSHLAGFRSQQPAERPPSRPSCSAWPSAPSPWKGPARVSTALARASQISRGRAGRRARGDALDQGRAGPPGHFQSRQDHSPLIRLTPS